MKKNIVALAICGLSFSAFAQTPANPLTFADTVPTNTVKNTQTVNFSSAPAVENKASDAPSDWTRYFVGNEYNGVYIRGGVGFSNTTLTVDSAAHGTSMTGQANDKFALDVDLGYRFNKYAGVEVGYVDFGKPTFSLQRGWSDTGDGQSNLTVHNQAWVLGVRGFLPIADTNFTATGRVGASFNQQAFNRSGDPSYSGNYSNTSVTVGLGGMYNFTKNIALIADVNYWPSQFPNTDNSIQTSAFTFTTGLSYQF